MDNADFCVLTHFKELKMLRHPFWVLAQPEVRRISGV